jgi:hypothetical protein
VTVVVGTWSSADAGAAVMVSAVLSSAVAVTAHMALRHDVMVSPLD